MLNGSVSGNLRDCVSNALTNGAKRGYEFRKMRHAIVVELKRLNCSAMEIRDVLSEWNKRCEKKLLPADAKRHLFAYIDWVFEQKECRISCKGLKDFCIGENECQYHLRTTAHNRQKTMELPFSMEELDKFLTERFKADGYPMMLVVKALRFYQQDRATGETILVG